MLERRNQLNKMRADFWAQKEADRLAGNAWIMRYGTDKERQEILSDGEYTGISKEN